MPSFVPIPVDRSLAMVQTALSAGDVTIEQVMEYQTRREAWIASQARLTERHRKEKKAETPAPKPPCTYSIGAKGGLVVRGAAHKGAKNLKLSEALEVLADSGAMLEFIASNAPRFDHVVPSRVKGEAFQAADPADIPNRIDRAIAGLLSGAVSNLGYLTPDSPEETTIRRLATELSDFAADLSTEEVENA